MDQWNFYFSGILYGKIFYGKKTLQVQCLDEKTALLGERHAYGQADEAYFEELCSRSLKGFFENLEEYEEKAAGHPDRFMTAGGEEFSARPGGYYQRRKKFPKDLFFENGNVYAMVMSGRDSCGVLVKKGMERETPLAAWEEIYPLTGQEEYQPGMVRSVKEMGTFFAVTRDGERLAADVYLPGGGPEGERVPAVLVRTPYGRKKGARSYFRYVQRGYGVVIQDTRGREDSTGEWLPEYFEAEDGDDTLNWIAGQTWSDGSVAMTGGSYLGYVQWAAASSGNPHLKAMLSGVCAGSAFGDFPRRGGCFNSGIMAWAFAMSEQRMRGDLMVREDWDQVLDIRPLEELAEKALGHPVSFLSKWLEHKHMDDFWKKTDWKANYKGEPVPALIMSGWFDDNGMGTTEALELVKSWPKGTWKTVLGPWKHSGNADYDIHGQFMGENALRYDMDVLCMKWLDHFLKGAENGVEKTPAAEYYTLGENRWKTAQAWPPESCRTVRLFLDGEADGAAAGKGSCCGKGLLTREEPGCREGSDGYVYDPEHPAVHLVDMSENELSVPEDYTEEEKRPDLLSYTTPPFKEPFVITGDARVRLFVSCDCPDTDVIVRITDVDENGRSVKLADGVLGAKYRNGFDHPEYMEPGGVYELAVLTTKCSNAFLPGHRLRLTVTSGAKNFVFPNSNTKEGFDSPVKRKASVLVRRGGNHCSSVEFGAETAPVF